MTLNNNMVQMLITCPSCTDRLCCSDFLTWFPPSAIHIQFKFIFTSRKIIKGLGAPHQPIPSLLARCVDDFVLIVSDGAQKSQMIQNQMIQIISVETLNWVCNLIFAPHCLPPALSFTGIFIWNFSPALPIPLSMHLWDRVRLVLSIGA